MTPERYDQVCRLFEEAQHQTPVERDDFMARACPDPELRAEVRRLFVHDEAAARVAFLERPCHTKPQAIDSEDAVGDIMIGRRIGSYEIRSRLACGGMGVVYEAWHVELQRTVALKMIRAGYLASAAEVTRFRLEAEAVAQLDHPHIVPIYDVGEFDGQPYFAMKLIRGGNLAESNARLNVDSRAAAQLMATTARAIHHAHQRGILHRDLKPSNILIDADCQPYVTDFGLAKRLETGPTLSRTTAVMGTPSYMAPEQAAGRKDLSTAVDVYGLGAILYELLTGRPPFRGTAALDTLRCVQEKEPVRPRMLNHRVDRDLETICLACLEKDAQRRYSSAEALAEDLGNWLTGVPIERRSIGTLQRGWRWCRRKPLLAGLIGGVAVAAVSLIVVTALLLYATHQLRAANQKIRTGFLLAQQAVGPVFTKVAEDDRFKSGPLEDIRLDIRRAEGEFYQRFVELHGDEPDFQAERGRALLRLAEVTNELDATAVAIDYCRQAVEVFTELVSRYPNSDAYQTELANCSTYLGELYRNTRRWGEAEHAFGTAWKIRNAFTDRNPDDLQSQALLADSFHNLGVTVGDSDRTRVDEAERNHLRAVTIERGLLEKQPGNPEFQALLARSLGSLGKLYQYNNRRPHAEGPYKEALGIFQHLVRRHPQVHNYRASLALANYDLGTWCWDCARPEAEDAYLTALAQLKDLSQERPKVVRYQYYQGVIYLALGRVYMANRAQDSKREFRNAVDILTKVARENREVLKYQIYLARSHQHLVDVCVRLGLVTGQWSDAKRVCQDAIKVVQDLGNRYPDEPEYQRVMAKLRVYAISVDTRTGRIRGPFPG